MGHQIAKQLPACRSPVPDRAKSIKKARSLIKSLDHKAAVVDHL
jgi:hypothetical protein